MRERRLDGFDLRFGGNRREALQSLFDHGEPAVEPARRPPASVANDPRRQTLRRGLLFGGGAERNAHGLEPGGIHVGVAVERLDEHGPVRRQRIHFRKRKVRLTVEELRLAPAAQRHQPHAIGQRVRLGPQNRKRLGAAVDAV